MTTATDHAVHVRDNIYIGGEWVQSTGTGVLEVINSTTEQVMGSVPEGTVEDVDKAVAAARSAFESWSQTSVEERADWMQRIAEALGARMDEIAELIAQEVGMPVKLANMIQAGLPTMTFGSMPKVMAELPWEEELGNSLIVREPVGVVGAITPWNYPLYQISLKVAPALAAGCTVVLKPSEVAPLNAFVLAEVFEEIGLPAGVFNLVTGVGPVEGEAIAAHTDVDMVSFTGSTRAGKRVSEVASGTVKRVALELGGKSANVILDDADLANAVPDGVAKCYLNSGQTCSALTRMLVPGRACPRWRIWPWRPPRRLRPVTRSNLPAGLDPWYPGLSAIGFVTSSTRGWGRGQPSLPVAWRHPRVFRRDSSFGRPCSAM